MALYKIKSETLTNIGDAIRAKNGTTALLTPPEMATAISSLSVGAASPEMCSVALTFKTFTGYCVYNDSSSWQKKYHGATSYTISVPVGSLILICIYRSDYSLNSIRVTSGTATTESSIMSDSNSACTYIIPQGDCAITVQGAW